MYLQLQESQWKLHEIDSMDIHAFFRLMSKDDKPKKSKSKSKSNNVEDFYNSI